MKFIIREMDWFKRRTPMTEPKPVSVVVEGVELIHDHTCMMVATYDDGNAHKLNARVHHNDIRDTWTVHGLDHEGHSVLCDIRLNTLMKHLEEVNETYFQHFKVAAKIAAIGFAISVVALIHAICPCVFEKTGGELLEKALDIKNNR